MFVPEKGGLSPMALFYRRGEKSALCLCPKVGKRTRQRASKVDSSSFREEFYIQIVL